MSQVRSAGRRWGRPAAVLVALTTAVFIALPAGTAFAVAPSVKLLNPDQGDPGGTDFLTSKEDTNTIEHLSATATDPDNDITQVRFERKCGTETLFTTIGTDTSAPYEANFDTSGIANGTKCDIKATAFDQAGASASDTEANIDVDNRRAGVEITSPGNGATLYYFAGAGGVEHATVRGTASGTGGAAGTTALTGVEAFFTTDPDATEPTWTVCGEDLTDDDAATAGFQFTIDCNHANVATATAVKALANSDATGNNAFDGGDAHEVTPTALNVTLLNISITPTSDNATANVSCNEYTATVTSSQSNLPVGGVNVDVHAQGPNDDLHFAKTGAAAPRVFRSTADEHVAGDDQDKSADCTKSAPNTQFNGTDDAAVEAGTADTNFHEGEHVLGGTPDVANIKHVEGETDNNGQLVVAILSAATGSTTVEAWPDVNTADNDLRESGQEPLVTATKTWQTQVISLDAEPEQDGNNVGSTHSISVTAKDQSNEPVVGVDPLMHVHTGPNAGLLDDCDANTDTAGKCTITYTSAAAGTDAMTVWLNTDPAGGAHHDGNDAQDDVTKTWVTIPAGACLDGEPEDDLDAATDEHVITGTLTDSAGANTSDDTCAGSAIANAEVSATITDDTPNAYISSVNGVATTGQPNTASGDTNASGQVTFGVKLVDPAGSLAADSTDEVRLNVAPETTDEAVTVTTDNKVDKVKKRWAQAGAGVVLDVEPEVATNQKDATHTLTATATDAFGSPAANTNVDFFIYNGPNAGTFRECTTTSGGTCSVSYASTKVGDDFWRAWIDANGDNAEPGEADVGEGAPAQVANVDAATDPGDTAEPDNTDAAFKRWTAAAPTPADVELDLFAEGAGTDDTFPPNPNTKVCNANLADLTDQAGNNAWEGSHTGSANTIELVCTSAQDAAGNTLYGATVTLSSSGVGSITDNNGPPPSTSSQTATIGADGYAEFYIFSTSSGTQSVTATAGGVSDTGTKTWGAPAAGEARVVDCEPESATRNVDASHEVTCTATDGFGNPAQGVGVTWAKADSEGASSVFLFQQTTTDANGQARATVSSSSAGSTSVTGSISAAATECEEGPNQPGPEDQGKPAGVCSDSVDVAWSPPPPPPECPGLEGIPGNHVVGTNGDDVLTGSEGFDIICGLDGDDAISGLGGGDILIGGLGNDVIDGGGGRDSIRGNAGADTLIGAGAADDVTGGPGNDVIRGGAGPDFLSGGSGDDVVRGFDGSDVLIGGGGDDALYGGGGNDFLDGRAGTDLCRGGVGRDEVRRCEV